MLKNRFDIYSVNRGLILVLGFCVASFAGQVSAQQETPAVTAQTESFLSNRSSVGALVGGILAGASFATPFAPLGGTIVGFFVGKSTDYSKADEQAKTDYSRRSFAPVNTADFGGEQLALSDQSSGVTPSLAFSTTGADTSQPAKTSAPVPVEKSQPKETPIVAAAKPEAAPEPKPESVEKPEPVEEPKREPVHLVITKEVGVTQNKLDAYAEIIRQEQGTATFEPNPHCPSADAPRYRKKLAVAGFSLEHPDQAVFGGLGEVGEAVSMSLYQRMEQSGRVQAFSAPRWQMYASSSMTPAVSIGTSNQLIKYSAISREMGAQFVVSGIIRDVGVNEPDSWNTSYGSKLKRALSHSDQSRNFVLDMIVHDGYTGRVVLEKHYSGTGAWDVSRQKKINFGSSRFYETAYGEVVEEILAQISSDVLAQLDCQPMIVPVIEVTGKDLLLDVGTPSGLLPGAHMHLLRAENSLARPSQPSQLWDTGVQLHIHSLSLDSARAWMPKGGPQINIQKGDYAVIY